MADGEALKEAACLTLLTRGCSVEAGRLMDAVVSRIIEWEKGQRKTQRREKGLAKLRLAAGVFVGGMLLNCGRALDRSAWSYQPTDHEAFTEQDVGARPFLTVRDALRDLGLIEERPAFRRFYGPKVSGEMALATSSAARFRPSPALWSLADQHVPGGVVDMDHHVHRIRPRIIQPLRIRELSRWKAGARIAGKPLSLPNTPERHAMEAEVARMNEWLAAARIEGCDPVAFHRGFTSSLQFGGRWYASGESYQGMPQSERVSGLRINGTQVVEVDASASHLSILHGLVGRQLPDGDPYAIGNFPREVVKAWVSVALGKGQCPRRWTARAASDLARKGGLSASAYPAASVGAAVLRRYPFLADLPAILSCPHEPRLASLRLQRIEADAMTSAMVCLRSRGIHSLPLHDALVVPHDAAEAGKHALADGYGAAAGVRPNFRVEPARADF
jgi:hypothetical protein